MSEWDTTASGFRPLGAGGEDRSEIIELVGPHLRVAGTISLLRFNRLSDLINHSRGFVKLTDASLLRRNGEPTGLVVQELMVNQDEITFIGHKEEEVATAEAETPGGAERPMLNRTARQLVIFTPGHTITGTIYLFAETDVQTFVDSADTRFVPMLKATARSLADRRVISHFGLILLNRTQMTAASLLEKAGEAAETGVGFE